MASKSAKPIVVANLKPNVKSNLKLSKWLAAREIYEHYGVSFELLGAVLNLKPSTIQNRASREVWQLAKQDDLVDEHQKLVAKLYQVVEVHFEHVAQLGNDEAFGEKKTRALTTLAATLEKLSNVNMKTNALIGKMNGEEAECEKQKPERHFSQAEIAEFREKLANRIEAFIK